MKHDVINSHIRAIILEKNTIDLNVISICDYFQ